MKENDHAPLEVQFERVLPGPIERVWDYLTNPELVETWLDKGVTYRRVTHCVPLSVLEYTLSPPRDESGEGVLPSPEVVTFELEPHGGQVLLRLTVRRLVAETQPGTVASYQARTSSSATLFNVAVVTLDLDAFYDTLENQDLFLRAA